MRLSEARIPVVAEADLTAEQASALEAYRPGSLPNVFRTIVQAPEAMRQFAGWTRYILKDGSDLTPRAREIVILRTGFLCLSGYEFMQHVEIGLRSGLDAADIARIKQGPEAGWSAAEAALIRVADELHDDFFVSDATWSDLTTHYTQKQCMDVVFTVGQYTQVSMMLNTFGVQLDDGLSLDPDLKGF